MDLKTFNFYQYIKEKTTYVSHEKFFMVDNETYKDLQVDFPFRTTHYGIGVNYGAGTSDCRIGSDDHQLSHGCLITVGPGIITQWQGQYELKNETIFFSDDLFSDLKVSVLRTLPYFMHGGEHVISLPEQDLNKMLELFRCIGLMNGDTGVIAGLVYSMIGLTQLFHSSMASRAESTAKEQITKKFRTLLSRNFIKHKEVSFYASELNITPKYLSEVLLNTTGKTAKELINEHVILEAKSLLKQTDMTISEIAYWLGFNDISYFVRMFKKVVQSTPQKYRNGKVSNMEEKTW